MKYMNGKSSDMGFLILVVIVAMLVYLGVSNFYKPSTANAAPHVSSPEERSQGGRSNDPAQLASWMAEGINADVPIDMHLPDGTEMAIVLASAQGSRLTYHIQVYDLDVRTIDRQAAYDVFSRIVLSQTCSVADDHPISVGVETAYSYTDYNGQYITQVLVRPGDCG